MTPRDRTLPIARPAFADAPQPRNSHTNIRLMVDLSAILSIAGLLIGGGMAWQKFLDDGKRLDQHDQEIAALVQIEQQQQQTMAALSQNVADIKDSLKSGGGQ